MTQGSTQTRCLVVSIHDVSPATLETTQAMLNDLAQAGVTRTSLLVIPNHHHAHPIREDSGFQRQVRSWAQDGHEIVLHGYFHQRTSKHDEGLRDRAVTRFYTAGEGEFYDLTYGEAEALLRRGLDDFTACGFGVVTGFIAPAWLLGAEAECAVSDAGFHYTTLLGGIKHLRPTPSFNPSQSLVYSVRATWRVACSLVWNALLARHLRNNPIIRLGLHPPDWNHPHVRKQALQIASRMAATRRVTTYAAAVSGSSS